MTLPRMSFEFVNLQYDPTRKSTQTQTIINQTPDGIILRRIMFLFLIICHLLCLL